MGIYLKDKSVIYYLNSAFSFSLLNAHCVWQMVRKELKDRDVLAAVKRLACQLE